MAHTSGQRGGDAVGRTRGGPTTKWHAVCDGNGIPLAMHLGDGRAHDITQATVVLEKIRAPRRGLAADKGYDSRVFREYLSRRRIRHSIPKRRQSAVTMHRSELAGRRWVIERLFRFYQGFRRLMLRHERHAFIHLGLLQVASIIITLRHF